MEKFNIKPEMLEGSTLQTFEKNEISRKLKIKLISLSEENRKIGETVHYPPATKEWVNSTYSYNKNYTKTLPVTDNVVNKLIKGYLTMNPLINGKKTKRVDIRLNRLSLNQILVSKSEVKHTANKVIITVYLYNKNKKFYLYKLKNLYLGVSSSKVGFKNKTNRLYKKNKKTQVNAGILTTKKNYLKKKLKFISLRAVKLINKTLKRNKFLMKTLSWNNNSILNYRNKYYKNFIKNAYKIELLYMYNIRMLSLNNNKFKNWFILGLKKVISKLYNKKVEFNFVSLKYLHLNSDIFTQSIVTRVRNRDNSLMRVLKKVLRLAKIPSRSLDGSYHGIDQKVNIIPLKNKALPLITPLENINLSKPDHKAYDVLHILLNRLFPADPLILNFNNQKLNINLFKAKKLNNKQINILDSIKYKTVLGVRLEAAGRLSKRLTASRSVFRLKYKGGINNIHYWKKGVSSVVLRGNTNTNLQYTLINSKTRNGSFGIKGWISGN